MPKSTPLEYIQCLMLLVSVGLGLVSHLYFLDRNIVRSRITAILAAVGIIAFIAVRRFS